MDRKHIMPGLCIAVLLLLPAWTLVLWWLQDRIYIAVGVVSLIVALLILKSFPRIHVPPAGSSHGLFCPRCGYDLRGNDSGICPECGTARK